MNNENKSIEIPFGAKDSELGGWEYTIPEGFEAIIENGKVKVRKTDSEDEKIRKELLAFVQDRKAKYPNDPKYVNIDAWIDWIEKQNQNLEKIKLEKGKWYFCIENYHPRADCTDFYQGEKYRCEKDGVMGVWRIKNPEKYFRECETPTYAGSDAVRIRSIIQVLEYARSLSAYNQFGKDDITKDIAWLEKQKTSEEAMKYLEENHSPSEMSDFQAAMNIAVAKAFDAGKKQGEQKPIPKDYDAAFDDFMSHIPEKDPESSNSLYTYEDMEAAIKFGIQFGKQQKPEWSEEDEKMRTRCAACLGYHYQGGMMTRKEYKEVHNWLESLKERVQPQPKQEWSEKDDKILKEIISDVKFEGYNNDMQADSYSKIDWLKSLRPQKLSNVERIGKNWKPSEEQMYWLKRVIPHTDTEKANEGEVVLNELFEQLKAL